MADYTFLANIFSNVDAATTAYITSTISGVCAAVRPVAMQCFTLYIILWGFSMYRGLIDEPLMDAAFRLARIGLILHFALSVGEYSGKISNNLQNLPDYLTALIGNGGAAGDSKQTLDKILSDTINVGNALWEQGSLVPPDANPGAYFMAIIVWASAMICTGYAAFLIILSKIALAIVLGMGPIFITCLIFDGTKKFFDAWIGQAINYALVAGLTVSVIKLLFGMYANVAAASIAAAENPDFSFASVASLLILAVVCALVLLQVQTIAAALAGGVAVSTMGAASWASAKASGAGRAMRPGNIQKSMRNVGRDVRAVKAGAKTAAAPAAWVAKRLKGANTVGKAA